MGGLISILGFFLVASFIFGSLLTYSTFQQVNQQTLENYVDVPQNFDCEADGNECQHLNATQLFPFVLIADNNDPSVKVANLSTYILSEFYIYHLDLDGSETYTWYDAVPCIEYYEQIYGSLENMPKSLQRELIGVHSTQWMCPNMQITGDEQYVL
jgi:hypothetical protein